MTQRNLLFQINVTIETGSDGFFWAFSDDERALNGGGETIEAVKQSIFECIELQKELGNFSHKNYEVIFIEP